MGIKRKQHSAEFKARVAMASLSGEKTLAELSAEFGVHPTMISNWKQELVKRAGELFARGNKAPAVAARQACGLVDLVGRNTARIELLEAAAQSGRRYENGDADLLTLGSHAGIPIIDPAEAIARFGGQTG